MPSTLYDLLSDEDKRKVQDRFLDRLAASIVSGELTPEEIDSWAPEGVAHELAEQVREYQRHA